MHVEQHNTDPVGEWVMERAGGAYNPDAMTAIGVVDDDGNVKGGVVYSQYTGANGSVIISVAGEGRWLTRDMLFMAFHYPFEQLKVRKILALISSTNEKSIRFNMRLGFVPEAFIPETMPDGDMFIMSMTRAQCPWLADKYIPTDMKVIN